MEEQICRDLQQAGLPVDWINQGGDSRNFATTTQSIKLMTDRPHRAIAGQRSWSGLKGRWRGWDKNPLS